MGGGLVLVLAAARFRWDFVMPATLRELDEDKHKAPASTLPCPLSLQMAGPQASQYL